jgi:hypothetical protein
MRHWESLHGPAPDDAKSRSRMGAVDALVDALNGRFDRDTVAFA